MTASRRQWLATGGVAAAAAAAGVGGYAWHRRDDSAATAADDFIWSLEFDTPSQTRLAMASLPRQPLLLNFWATWCPPCVREMPVLERFFKEQGAKGWQVLGLAADNASAVRDFLARTPITFPIVLAGFEGVELSRRLGNPSGGLPFSVVFAGDRRLLHRHVGETHYEQLTGWARGIS
jgi:thiol-disulfide isomerase/thioredoxin